MLAHASRPGKQAAPYPSPALPGFQCPHPPRVDALLEFCRCLGHTVVSNDLLCSGVEATYLLLALKQVHCDRLHFLLLVFGSILPFFLVFSSFGVSVYLGAEIYVRTYTADGHLVPNPMSVASFANLKTICWLRPEFVLELELIPVAIILFFNLAVLFFAVFLAFKSATYR